MTTNITIHYCSQCRFLLRANWLAEEILMTFGETLEAVTLRPGHGGIFDVYVGDELVFSKQRAERFPDSAELKQLIRDRVAPEMSLGHSDKKTE